MKKIFNISTFAIQVIVGIYFIRLGTFWVSISGILLIIHAVNWFYHSNKV